MKGPCRAADQPGGPTASEDSLLGGRVRLRQPAEGYRVAVDPVLLAAAVPAGPDSRVLDLGCGVGAAALCLLARVPQAEVTGWEVQEDLAELACENGHLNGHDGGFRVVLGDISKRTGVRPGRYDEVLCNPPHQPADAPTAPDPSKARATQEGGTALEDWIEAALFHTWDKGGITLIHRADRLDDLLATLKGRAGGIVVFPLWPGGGKPAKRVILRAVKGSKAPLRLAAGLTLHRADGTFTPEAEAVLRDGAGLALSGMSS